MKQRPLCFLPKENALVTLSRALILLELLPHKAPDGLVCLCAQAS